MKEHPSAIIAGVGPGLGHSLVKAFCGAGFKVVMAARDPEHLADLYPEGSDGEVVAQSCDVTDPASVAGLFETADDTVGTPDVVIYNAGAFVPGRVLEIKPAEFERCWRVGCFGGFLIGQQAAQRMLKAGRGTIIFTGATAALRGGAGYANLSSPKFALRSLSQTMARELGPENIHVAHVIIDGQIRSERSAPLEKNRGPDSLLDPDHVAQNYLHLARQPRTAWTQELDLRPWSEKF